MNLTNFLKQTDAITSQYSMEQLIDFIHDIGRICPERCREDFLERLKFAGNGAVRASNKNEGKDIDFDGMYNRVRDHLKSIDSQEVTITAIWNEEYNDWYDDSDEEFYYEDNNGISDMLEEACDFLHICMDREKYKEGFAVGKQLLEMEILCDNEYEELSLGDMAHYELLHCDLKQVILDTAYCAYHAVQSAKRQESLYGVIVNAKEDTITLEAVMQHGDEELPEFEEFLPSWITYLGDKTGHDAERLILEAVDLLNDLSMEVRCAKKYAAVHPGLYLNILKNGKHMPADDMAAIGFEAMKAIPKKYVIRSKAALETAEYVIAADEEQALLEKCYFAACESDTSAQNYLRALLNGYGDGKKKEELHKLLGPFPVHKGNGYLSDEGSFYGYGGSGYLEREENKPSNNMVLTLMFLDGQFAEVLDKGLQKAEALGWTGTFMKQGIALFLIYLHEGRWNGEGIVAMAEMAKNAMGFSAIEYRKGTCVPEEMDGDDLFSQLFSQWKAMMPMTSDIRDRAIKRITALLKKRTAGIMEANRRNYYGECAAYIAALGEVQESMGEPGAKQRLMTSYKDAYPRRSAFREEMRNYGWIDVKRK